MKKILCCVVWVFVLVLFGCNANINYWTVDMRADANGSANEKETGNATNVFSIKVKDSTITTSKKSDANGEFDVPVTDIIKEVLPKLIVPLSDSTETKNTPVPLVDQCVVDQIPQTPGQNTEKGNYHGRTNGNRPTWYFSKDMKDYPAEFSVVVEGCGQITATNNDNRFEENGFLVKQSNVSGRGMAVLAPPRCTSKEASVVF